MIRLMFASVVTLFLGTASIAQAEELVRQFSGSRSTETAEFEVKAPWLVDWRVNSDYPSSMGISVALTKGGTEAYMGKVFKSKKPANGVRLMDESGRFRFKVDATIANWSLKVIQLTPGEAEQYKPKSTIDF